jgi:predicted TIM-barrel fold metal-dependent hydrolase
MLPACYDPTIRAQEMAGEGIIASVPFPTLPGFGGRVFNEFADKELADLCVRAYNDFMIDEWCGAAPDFYVPTTIVQLWDPELAAAEIRRCAERGARTIAFPDNPYPMGLPSIHQEWWDPVWRALVETETVVSLHIGGSGRIPAASPDTRFTTSITMGPASAGMEMLGDIIFSRVPHEFPEIKFVVTEGGIGYVPFLLERIDYAWEKNRAWDDLWDERPSDTFQRIFWVCAVNEEFGLANRDRIGVDKVLWECDFPHAETPYPNSQREAEKQFSGMPERDVEMITHLNAQKLFRFEGTTS